MSLIDHHIYLGITLSAAEVLGVDETVGSLKVGKEANLVILEKNPLKTSNIEMKNIKIVNRVFQGHVCQ